MKYKKYTLQNNDGTYFDTIYIGTQVPASLVNSGNIHSITSNMSLRFWTEHGMHFRKLYALVNKLLHSK